MSWIVAFKYLPGELPDLIGVLRAYICKGSALHLAIAPFLAWYEQRSLLFWGCKDVKHATFCSAKWRYSFTGVAVVSASDLVFASATYLGLVAG